MSISLDFCSNTDFPLNWESVILPIDKPKGITSFDVIRKLRRITGQRKIGHAGTLDPMATGLLICLFGSSTKQMSAFLEMPKTYTGTIRLGQTTASFDADTPVITDVDPSHLALDDIRQAATEFIGEIRQLTPIFSAVKHEGERLYKKARRGENITSPTRDVSIYSFTIDEITGADVRFEISCSKGTYIRAVANDLGKRLAVGAHLTELRRTAIGEISLEESWSLSQVEDRAAQILVHVSGSL